MFEGICLEGQQATSRTLISSNPNIFTHIVLTLCRSSVRYCICVLLLLECVCLCNGMTLKVMPIFHYYYRIIQCNIRICFKFFSVSNDSLFVALAAFLAVGKNVFWIFFQNSHFSPRNHSYLFVSFFINWDMNNAFGSCICAFSKIQDCF